jgi:hypothetical protein
MKERQMNQEQRIKMDIEIAKILAEISKLTAETAKIQAESHWYPWVVASGAAIGCLGIIATMVVAIIKN